jgi:hypothetical protein
LSAFDEENNIYGMSYMAKGMMGGLKIVRDIRQRSHITQVNING